jgi:hypothetical protein
MASFDLAAEGKTKKRLWRRRPEKAFVLKQAQKSCRKRKSTFVLFFGFPISVIPHI